MPANEVALTLNTQDFEARLARVKKELAEVVNLASQATLGGGNGNIAGTPAAAAIRQGLSSISTSEASVKSTATNGGPTGPTAASVAAGQAVMGTNLGNIPLGSFYRTPAGQAALAAAGMPQAPAAVTPPFGTQTMVAATVASAQTMALPAWNQRGPWPAGMNVAGSQVPGAGWTTFDHTMMMAAGGTSAVPLAGAGPSVAAQDRARSSQLGRYVIAGIAGQGIGSALSLYAQQTATGDYDPMAASGLWGAGYGAAVGGIGGMLATPTAPGAGFATGSMMGFMIGGPAAQAAMAPFARNRTMALTLASTAARMGVSPQTLIQGGSAYIDDPFHISRADPAGPGGLSAQAQQWSRLGKSRAEIAAISAGTYFGTDIISGPQLATVYGNIASGLMAGGELPSDALAPASRLAWKYGQAAPGMSQMAARGYAVQNQFGRNRTDILLSVGPEAYGAYADAEGKPDITVLQRDAFRRHQTVSYRAEIEGLRSRGSGSALYTAYGADLLNIGALPDGRDSLAYAETFARKRGAGREAFEQRAAIEYGIPQARVEAARGILSAMPYGPGNRMAIELTAMNISGQQIGRLNAYMLERRKRGELTEMEELDINQQIGRLQVSVAQGIGALSEGVLDRIPALSTNAPNGWRRFDSMQMAAINLGGMGSPNRRHGAMGGQQARMQDQFVSMFGMGNLNPYSKTEGLNNPAVADIASTLRQMLELMLRGAQIPGFNGSSNANPLPPNNGTGPQGRQVPF